MQDRRNETSPGAALRTIITYAGKLIAIDGTDGSGKKTQTLRLIERIEREGMTAKRIEFPRYEEESSFWVRRYLRDKAYGDTADAVHPEIGSLFYIVDRMAASPGIRRELAAGTHLVTDRYVSANIGHQTAKIEDEQERERFRRFLDHQEHDVCGIPRPDITIILRLPAEMGQAASAGRTDERATAVRDLHESDVEHLKKAERAYVEAAVSLPGWELVQCIEDGRRLTEDEVHERVWALARPILLPLATHDASVISL